MATGQPPCWSLLPAITRRDALASVVSAGMVRTYGQRRERVKHLVRQGVAGCYPYGARDVGMFRDDVLVDVAVVFASGEIAHILVLGPLVADMAPAHVLGRYLSVYTLTFTVSPFGPAIDGLLLQTSPDAIWWGWRACRAAGRGGPGSTRRSHSRPTPRSSGTLYYTCGAQGVRVASPRSHMNKTEPTEVGSVVRAASVVGDSDATST